MRAAGGKKAGAYAKRKKLPAVIPTEACVVCGAARPPAPRPHGWDVHLDADTNTWTFSCSAQCRKLARLKERFG